MESRKRAEIEFHNRLRQGHFEQRWSIEAEEKAKHDPLWSNFKFYSREKHSTDDVRNWPWQHSKGKHM